MHVVYYYSGRNNYVSIAQDTNLWEIKSRTNFLMTSDVIFSFFSWTYFFPLGISIMVKNGKSSLYPTISLIESHIWACKNKF